MTVKFSLAHLTVLGTTPLDLIQIAADAGYDYASIRMTAVARRRARHAARGRSGRWSAVCRSVSPTPASQVLDVELARLGPDDEPEQVPSECSKPPPRSGPGTSSDNCNDPDRHRATERFGRLCDLALDFGLTVDLEFPSWSETGDLLGAVAVVRAVDRSNAGILIDALHFFRSNSSIDELAALPPEWFRFVQLCDAPADAAADRRGRDPHRAFSAFAAGVWPPAAPRTARTPPGRALLAGGPQRRLAARTGNDRIRPPGLGDRSRRRRRPRAPSDEPLTVVPPTRLSLLSHRRRLIRYSTPTRRNHDVPSNRFANTRLDSD